MAISATTVWQFNPSLGAGAAMLNGGGFNTGNANMLTDLTTDANTANTNSPIVSSASYNFAAGDVGALLYIKSGTNWTPGFYPIASVASNKATLSAAIDQAAQPATTAHRPYAPNTVAGCATVGTPTNGTFSINYANLTTARINGVTDFNAVGASTTLTSATAGFTPVMVGNIFHQTTTGTGGFGTVGWYEIVSYTNATTVVLDRAPNGGTASVNTTGYVGGALDLTGTISDSFFEAIIPGNVSYFKTGTYSATGQAINVAATVGTATTPSYWIGYTSVFGDTTNGSSRPLINYAANVFSPGTFVYLSNLSFTGTSTTGSQIGTGGRAVNCKYQNTSISSGRVSSNPGTDSMVINCEMSCQNGLAVNANGSNIRHTGNYVHDSPTGFSVTANTSRSVFAFNIVENCATAVSVTGTGASNPLFLNNTLYGWETPQGTGVSIATTVGPSRYMNNIIYGFTTGIVQATGQLLSNDGFYNDFYNNTTDVSLYTKDITDIAVNPQFVNASQLTGSTATTSGSVLTQSGGDFSTVTDNVDYLYLISGTGTTNSVYYLITSHTATTVTLNQAPGTNATADKVWSIGVNSNFAVGTNLKATAFPGAFPGSDTTGYLDIGAVQRQEAGSGSFTFS